MNEKTAKLIAAAKKLQVRCNELAPKLIDKTPQIELIYNPLDYAWKPHKEYIKLYGGLGAKTIVMGMNPGHGMGNTGIPFGCPDKVRNYLKIKKLEVRKPKKTHPKREIFGLKCKKPEISGKRIWGLVEELYGSPEKAFENIFVTNHFPLWMFNELGQNITPDKLNLKQSKALFDVCDEHLINVTKILKANTVVCVGKYAERMAKNAFAESDLRNLKIKMIPHPSPANPIANKDKGSIWKRIASDVIKTKKNEL